MSSPYERFARGARRDYRSEERRNNIVFAGYTVGVILLTGLAIRYVDKRKIWKLIEMYSAEIERLTKAIDEQYELGYETATKLWEDMVAVERSMNEAIAATNT